MEGLNMTELNKKNQTKFDHSTYAKLVKYSPIEAEKYINSFNKTEKSEEIEQKPLEKQLVIEPKEIRDTQKSLDEVTIAEVEETIPETSKLDQIVVTKEDMVELRKVYEEKFNKKPFVWWNAQKLIEKINKV